MNNPILEPRHIPRPNANYGNSTEFSECLLQTRWIIEACGGSHVDTAKLCAYKTAIMSAEYNVPLFFVGEEFFKAVAGTKLPPCFDWKTVMWPMPVLTFVVPEHLTGQFLPGFPKINHKLAYLTLCVTEKGDIPSPKSKWPWRRLIVNAADKHLCMCAWVRDGRGHFFIYGANLLPADTIDKLYEYPYEWGESMIFDEAGNLVRKECDREYSDKDMTASLTELALKLVISMTFAKELVEPGFLLRKARTKKGRTKPELWSPNWIGKRYVIKRESQGGTHASPRMHWRIGHIRNQHYGERNSKVKQIWIEPVLVSATEKRS